MMIPESIGPYQVVKVLGKGSMGTVYQARDPRFDRVVALKTISQESLEINGEGYMARFTQEAKAAGRLNHPAIVTVHDFSDGTDGEIPFLAMEFVEGTTLEDMLHDDILLPPDQVVGFVRDLADALAHAHDRGVIHRDLKPANVILTTEGQIKLMDFGIARMDASDITHHGQLVGTPSYMSPEQIKGESIDGRADIFGLGVLFYFLLTGSKPFSGQDVSSVLYKINHADYLPLTQRNPDLDPGLDLVMAKMLAKIPDDRFADCHDLAHDLEQYLQQRQEDPEKTVPSGQAVDMDLDPAPETAEPFPRKLFLLFCLLVLSLVFVWFNKGLFDFISDPIPPGNSSVQTEDSGNESDPVDSNSGGQSTNLELTPEPITLHKVGFTFEHRLTQGSFYIISGNQILFSRNLERKKSKVFSLEKMSFSLDLPEGKNSLLVRLVLPNREEPVDAVFHLTVDPNKAPEPHLKYSKVRRKFDISGSGVEL